MSCRSLSNALRSGDGRIWNAVGGTSRRTFTSSAIYQKHGPVPAFSKTSSTELDSILSTIRSKIFLPAHLSREQQKLVYQTKKTELLLGESVTANIGDEDFRLEHIDRLKDVPNTRKAVFQAVSLMKDKNDWDQLPILLEGLNNARKHAITRQHRDLRMLIRKAANAGRMDVIFECVRRVNATGFRLSLPARVAAIMHGIQTKAIESSFDPKETKQALSWTEMILEMMEEKKHAGGRVTPQNDPRTKIEIMAAPLHLAAVRSSRYLKGEDKDGKVQRYAERLLGTTLESQPPQTKEGSQLSQGDGKIYQINHWLISVLPALHGMRVALRILDPTSRVAVGLRAMADSLESTVNQQRSLLNEGASAEKPSLFALQLHDQLLGKEKLWT